MTQVMSSADVKASKTNITSANVVFGKRSYHEKGDMQLESLTQSNTCFSNNCGDSSFNVTANCNPGTYVYQITGYTGSNLNIGPFSTRFDIVCSDGYTASIGQIGTVSSSNVTISNRQGYTEVLVGGGCITDHIQIGGTDFGNAYFGPSSCSCAPGLSLVGFGTLPYVSKWPSFTSMSIQCDVTCPKGTYYKNGNCLLCDQGSNYLLAILSSQV